MPIDSDELDKLAVPVAVEPPAIESVAPIVLAALAAGLAPAADVDEVVAVDVDETDVDVTDVPVELDVVLVPGAAAVGPGAVIVVLLDAPVVGPCMFVDVVVWAWSAVVTSRSSAPAMVLDRHSVARTTE